jgi:hypothetical protein
VEKKAKGPKGFAIAGPASGTPAIQTPAIHTSPVRTPATSTPALGWAGRLLQRLRSGRRSPPHLALVERIALAPRQSLTLVEAEGRRILVATSAEGAAAFYALDQQPRLQPPLKPPLHARLVARDTAGRATAGNGSRQSRPARVSW